MTTIVMVSGKGGVGKTTITALILDELARLDYKGRVLAVDADPAMTLNLALDFPEPTATVADVRDAVRLSGEHLPNIPTGMTRAEYLGNMMLGQGVLSTHDLRGISVTLMAMGRGEGHGCYCSVNNTLSIVLQEIMDDYDLIVIDNEAGLECLSRYRVDRADYFLVVAGPDQASRVVAQRVLAVAHEVEMVLGDAVILLNRTRKPEKTKNGRVIQLPEDIYLAGGEVTAIDVSVDAPLRGSLTPVAAKIKEMANVREPVPPAEVAVL